MSKEVCKNDELHAYYDKDNGVTQYVCWVCGYYTSNSEACKSNPISFENLVRENPSYFIHKFSINRKETGITLPTRKQNHQNWLTKT